LAEQTNLEPVCKTQPLVGVCWYEAMAYAAWLPAVTRQSYRLPSEPEWEWAAWRGGRL
jgi:formylglycine-generating enzyme required for sulfatase activity